MKYHHFGNLRRVLKVAVPEKPWKRRVDVSLQGPRAKDYRVELK
jgi:hypothetical protein